MPRDLQFDRNAILERALDRFWRHGFHGTSMRDLAEELELSLSSLYHTFGSKQALFLAALERYDLQHMRPLLDRLGRELPPLEAIASLFKHVAMEGSADPQRRGCFLVNTALELSPHDPQIERIVRAKTGAIRVFLVKRLQAAQKAGAIAPEVDIRSRASHLLSVLLGLRVLARAFPERRMLERIVQDALGTMAHPGTSYMERR